MAGFCRLLFVLVAPLFVCSTASSLSSSSLSLTGENGNINIHKDKSLGQASAEKAVMAAIVDYLSQIPPVATTRLDDDVLEPARFIKDGTRHDNVMDDDTQSSEGIGLSAVQDPTTTEEDGVSSMTHKRQNFGSVLGGGYKLGKRELNRKSEVQALSYPSVTSFTKMLVGIKPPRNYYLPGYTNPYMDGGLENGLRKRQFGRVLGGGYKMGKRQKQGGENLGADSNEVKRQFGRVLGGGYKIGKKRKRTRNGNPYGEDEEREKRQFGSVLGGGYKLGKRGRLETDTYNSRKRQFGSVLGGGYKLGKRGRLETDTYNSRKRQFGSVLGGGYKLGKRERLETDTYNSRKRQFGSVLGGGYKLGKRERLETDTYNSRKPQFGSVLGGGYKLGKRELFETDAYDSRNDLRADRARKRQFGRVLGGGYKIGKRETGTKGNPYLDAFQSERNKREFGRVLGRGYKIGKRQPTGLDATAKFYPESTEQLPFQSNQNSIPFDKYPSSTAGILPSEFESAWDQNRMPVRSFPDESPAEWNQNRMPVGQQPADWGRDRMLAGQLPADLSLTKTVVVKQSLSLPQASFPPPDHFLLNFSPSQTLTKDFLQRDQADDTKHSPAFFTGPADFPAFSHQGGVPENRETAEQMDVAQLVYVLLEEAQTLLKLLPESHSFTHEAPFHQSEATTDSFSAPVDGSFRDIKRSIRRDPVSLLHKIQDWTERTMYENLHDKRDAKAEHEQSDITDDQEREEDSVLDRFPKHHKSKRSLTKEEHMSNPGKRWLFNIKFPRGYKLGKRTTMHSLSNPRKRWFFNIKFPRGYKLGKRPTLLNSKTPKVMKNLQFVPYPRHLDEEPINLIGSLTQYVSHLRNLIHQPKSRQKNPFTWKNPYGYMTKRESESRNTSRRGAFGPADSYRLANSVDGGLHPWRMPPRLALASHTAPLSVVLAWALHARRLNLQTQEHFNNNNNNNKYHKESQTSAKRRLRTLRPLVMTSRFPGGMPWGPKSWDPFGIFGRRKRDPPTELGSFDQFALGQSAENPARRSLNRSKRMLGRILGGYRIGKRSDPLLGREGRLKYQIQRFLRLLQSEILDPVKASAQRVLTGEADFDANKAKRILWTAPDGSKMWKMDPSPGSNIRMKRSVPHRNKTKQDKRSLESSIPDKVTQKRFFWKVLGGYILGKRTSLTDAKVYDSSQLMRKKRSDPSDIVKLVQSFRDIFEDTMTTKEFECFIKTLNGYMLSNFKGNQHENLQRYKELFPVRNLISKRTIWNFMREILGLANNSTSSSTKRQRRSCNQNHLETKRGKSQQKRSNTPAEEDNTAEDQTNISLHAFWDQVFRNFQQGKCQFDSTLSQKGLENSHLKDDLPTGKPGSTPLRHHDLRKHSSVNSLQNDHEARTETVRKNTTKKRFWGKIIGGYKIGKRLLADQPHVNEATSYDRSLKKQLWGEVLAGGHKSGKRNFSPHPQKWTQTAPVTVSKPNKTPRAGLHKKFWSKTIGGYNIPGKRPASKQRTKRSADHGSRDVDKDLKKQQQGEALVTGHDTGQRSPSAPLATQDSDEAEPGQWGTDIQDIWQQLQQDLPEEPQPHSPSDQLDMDQTLGESANRDPIPQPGQGPLFWKLLADFLFGPHLENDPGALLDFLDPSSFSQNVDSPDMDVISYSPQSQTDGASPPDSRGPQDMTTSEITSPTQKAA